MQILSEIVNKNVNIPEANPAIVTDHETLSYSQIENRILSSAAYFSSIGIRRNTKVALLSSNCADYVINILAAWLLNAIVIPLNIRLSDNELSEIIKFSDAEFLLIDNNRITKYSYINISGRFSFCTPIVNSQNPISTKLILKILHL